MPANQVQFLAPFIGPVFFMIAAFASPCGDLGMGSPPDPLIDDPRVKP